MENNQKMTQEQPILLDGDRCPLCREKITPADLEMFPRCPYCDHHFPQGAQLEDFVVKPAITRWVRHTCRQIVPPTPQQSPIDHLEKLLKEIENG